MIKISPVLSEIGSVVGTGVGFVISSVLGVECVPDVKVAPWWVLIDVVIAQGGRVDGTNSTKFQVNKLLF